MSRRVIRADGGTLQYRVRGRGPILLCQPGGPGMPAAYFGDLAGLDQDATLVLLDPRGTGVSSPATTPRGYTIEDYVADLDAVRADLGVERCDVLGHSHGGIVAATYAASHPDRVDHLVLANTLARFGPLHDAALQAAFERHRSAPWFPVAERAFHRLRSGDFAGVEEMRALENAAFPLYFAQFGERENTYREQIRGAPICADALRLFSRDIAPTLDMRPSLARITAPTLVLTGALDFVAGPAQARELIDALPHGASAVLPDVGHFPFVEAPTAFRGAVTAFLSAD